MNAFDPPRPDVLIVGAGPAGLTAAAVLARRGLDVLVLDREREAGGIPRHSDHTGYGVRDLRRVMTGPAYARRLVDRATDAGARIATEAMVTGWSGERTVEVTSPQGRFTVEARAVVLATGARERPRSARRIAGDRPAGVHTTGHLQNLVHGRGPRAGRPIGERAVVVGAEPVSWSAVLTLREAGCRTALMTTRHPQPEAYRAFTLPGRILLGVLVATRTQVVRIIGRGRVEAVEIEHLDTGARRLFACDTVVLTGDWIPDHELARTGGLDLDPAMLGPLVDTGLRTSRAGVYAAGNLVHPVDTADVAALDGAHVAARIEAWLGDAAGPADGVRLVPGAPFRWVTPGVLRPGDPPPPRGRLLIWTDELVRRPRVRARQDGRIVGELRVPWPASPGRVFRVPSAILDGVDPQGGSVHLGLG
jgi:thioredoxin reductase